MRPPNNDPGAAEQATRRSGDLPVGDRSSDASPSRRRGDAMPLPRATSHWDAASYARSSAFVSEGGRALVTLLDPRPGQRILDIGCGDGTLARDIAASGADVLAIDASPSFVAAARAAGVDAHLVDARALVFENEFDGAFSNAALHWMGPLPLVLRGVGRALRPGARFVGELGGDGNVAVIRAAIHAALARRNIDAAARDPWRFPTRSEFCGVLEDAGFTVDALDRFERPTPLSAGLSAWLQTFAEPFFGGLTRAERTHVLREVADSLVPRGVDADPSQTYVADYVRLRFIATVNKAQ